VPKSRYLHNVPCVQLLAVAEEMLEGEIAYRRGEHDAAFDRLRAAKRAFRVRRQWERGRSWSSPRVRWRGCAAARRTGSRKANCQSAGR
jgi:hypothetical protein